MSASDGKRQISQKLDGVRIHQRTEVVMVAVVGEGAVVVGINIDGLLLGLGPSDRSEEKTKADSDTSDSHRR